jgi:hypothetical protein
VGSGIKLLIGGLGIGAIVWAVQRGMKAAQNFNFEIAGYGTPRLSNWVLSLPIKIRFINPTNVSINADSVLVDIYLWKSNTFEFVGNVVKSPLVIAGGTSVIEIIPNIDLRKLFSGNILATAQNILSSRTVKVRADVSVTYSGITIPKQSITNDIDISSYI